MMRRCPSNDPANEKRSTATKVARKVATEPRTLATCVVQRKFTTSDDERHRRLMNLDSYDWADPKLLAAIRRNLPAQSTQYVDRVGALHASLSDALTTELRRLLFELREALDQTSMLQREAAFLFGLEVGKRLGDAARFVRRGVSKNRPKP